MKRLLVLVSVALCLGATARLSAQSEDTEDFEQARQRNLEKVRKEQAARVQARLIADADTTTVYMFAASFSFGDSVLYISDIKQMDNLQLTNKAYLLGRNAFSDQFANFLESNGCAVPQLSSLFFDEKKSKVIKKYSKVQRVAKKKNSFGIIKVEDFDFIPIIF